MQRSYNKIEGASDDRQPDKLQLGGRGKLSIFGEPGGSLINSLFWIIGSVSGGLGVALGAFGAHALRNRLDASRLETFETAVRYQIIHALALLGAALAAQAPSSGLAAASGWLFTAGTLLFSGSLYLLVFTGRRAWGAVTPFGGLAFIAGWACLALCIL